MGLQTADERWRPSSWHWFGIATGAILAFFVGLALLVLVVSARASLSGVLVVALATALRSGAIWWVLALVGAIALTLGVALVSQRRMENAIVRVLDADARGDAAVGMAALALGRVPARMAGQLTQPADIVDVETRLASAEKEREMAGWYARRDQPEEKPDFRGMFARPAAERAQSNGRPSAAAVVGYRAGNSSGKGGAT